MKKLLAILMLLALFVSCSDDDTTDPNNGNGNGKDMIDEKIIGKWKVEYSKTIKGARFLEDGTLEIAENAVTTEYEGNYDEGSTSVQDDIKSGLFDTSEYKIEINKDNTISVYQQYKLSPKTANYTIEDGLLKRKGIESVYDLYHNYSIKNGKLIIERIPTEKTGYIYAISEYSKITE